MEIIKRTDRQVTNIAAKTVSGVDVNINFEALTGEAPRYINASANIQPTVDGEQPTYINVTIQENGQKTTNVNGPKSITEVADLVAEIETGLIAIKEQEGGVA